MKMNIVEKNGCSLKEEIFVSPFRENRNGLFMDKFPLDYLIKKLSNAIEELPSEEILVLSLYYVEDLALPEIGDILGITQQKVRHIYYHAVSNLRKKVPELKAK